MLPYSERTHDAGGQESQAMVWGLYLYPSPPVIETSANDENMWSEGSHMSSNTANINPSGEAILGVSHCNCYSHHLQCQDSYLAHLLDKIAELDVLA